jgi:hypothetical protein
MRILINDIHPSRIQAWMSISLPIQVVVIADQSKDQNKKYQPNENIQMSKFIGTWHITEMEMWDEDYFNEDVQAYITINENNDGNFQFGYVTGSINGEITKKESREILEFTWDGSDECDDACGSGWLKIKTKTTLEGKIKIHNGDSSLFSVKLA